MKLEKVVARPKVGLWVFLFILGLAVVGTMATSYNFEIFARMKSDMIRSGVSHIPLLKIVFGLLGIATLKLR